jgi:predicted DNA-binding transcriptional regulator YafY
MPINKNAVIRYNTLDKCFSNFGRKYFFNDLLEEVNNALFEEDSKSTGVQIRQLREDIRFMKSESGYGAPIEAYRVGKKAYYRYDDQHFSINKSPLNKSEMDQLKSALSILQRFEGSPEFEWVNEIGPMLRDQFGLKDSEAKIIGYDSNIDYSGYEYIAKLFNAISNKQVLKIRYKSFNNDEFDFEFHPYYLKQYNNRWFVFGRNESNNINQWTVPLDRIELVEEVEMKYVNDKTDWEDYFYDIIGVTKVEGSVQEVELLFSKEQAPYIQTKPLHPSQRSKLNNDGTLEVKIKVIPNYELERLILSFGESVKTERPLVLKNRIESRIEKMQN